MHVKRTLQVISVVHIIFFFSHDYWLTMLSGIGQPTMAQYDGPKGVTTDDPSVAGCAFLLWATGGCLQWSPCGRYIGSLVGQCGMAIWGCRKSLQQWMTASLCTSRVSPVTTRSRLQHSPDRPGSQLARQVSAAILHAVLDSLQPHAQYPERNRISRTGVKNSIYWGSFWQQSHL